MLTLVQGRRDLAIGVASDHHLGLGHHKGAEVSGLLRSSFNRLVSKSRFCGVARAVDGPDSALRTVRCSAAARFVAPIACASAASV